MKRCIAHISTLMFAVLGMSATSEGASSTVEALDTLLQLPQVSVSTVKIGTGLRNKPISATVIKSDEIEHQGIINMHQISDMVPNFYMPRYGSRITSSLYVRGIGARIDQPAVGLTIDNIPILSKDNYDFDLDDMVRVDMIRGPQSTMYGRNTMSGLINISTLSPFQYNGIKIRAGGGSYGSYRGSVGAYHTFDNHVGVAVGGLIGGNDGYYHNEYTGRRLGGEFQANAWYKISWRHGAHWSIENTGRFYHSEQQGYPYESLETKVIAYNDTCFYKRNSWLDGLTVAWQKGAWSVSSVTSVQHIDDNMTLDQDFLPLSYFTLTQRRRETVVTQDIMVDHKGKLYNWMVGLSGFTRHTSMWAPVTFLPVGIERLIEDNRNVMNPKYPIKWDEPSFVLNSDFSYPTRGLGLYHNSTFTVGNFTFTGSLRLEVENPTLDFHSYTTTAYTIYDKSEPDVTAIFRHEKVELDERDRLSHTYVQLLPRLSVTYSLPGTLGNTYASFSKGYKPGGFNTQMFSDFLQQKLMSTMGVTELYDADRIISYKPESSFNYEVGAHITLLDGTLTIDGALFYIDCRNQQLTRFPDGTTTGRVMDNAGRTRSLGAELSAEYRISPHWVATASWGHSDARFIDYNDGINDYHNKFVPYAPLNTLHGTLRYESAIDAWHIDRVQIWAGVHGVGAIYWNESNTVKQPFYAPLQLSASVTSGIFSVRVWAENINRVKYSTFYFKSMGNEFVQRGAPFTINASLCVEI